MNKATSFSRSAIINRSLPYPGGNRSDVVYLGAIGLLFLPDPALKTPSRSRVAFIVKSLLWSRG